MTKIRHIAIAVRSLEEAVPAYRKLLGDQEGTEEIVEEQKVKAVFFSAGESRIELLEATGPDSPIAKFLERRGPGLHHIALTVPDLESALEELKQAGMVLIDEKPRAGAGGQRIAFVHPENFSGVLVELVEERGSGNDETR